MFGGLKEVLRGPYRGVLGAERVLRALQRDLRAL